MLRTFKNNVEESKLKIIYAGDAHISSYLNTFVNTDMLQSIKFIDNNIRFDYFDVHTYGEKKDENLMKTTLSDTGAAYLNSLI
jgi:hypothetical protein